MRSRRSVIRARLAVRSALRSSRLSLGPASDLRRARASAAVIGAGATGPFLGLRLASLRLGVGRPLRPVAPDCYGDSLSAVEAAAVIATGWNRSRPGDRFTVAPQSDGGPGFIEVLASRLGGRKRRSRVSGPLEETVSAEWVFHRASSTAYLEVAQACGLSQLGGPPPPRPGWPRPAGGGGRLIAEALRAGATRIVVGLGG